MTVSQFSDRNHMSYIKKQKAREKTESISWCASDSYSHWLRNKCLSRLTKWKTEWNTDVLNRKNWKLFSLVAPLKPTACTGPTIAKDLEKWHNRLGATSRVRDPTPPPYSPPDQLSSKALGDTATRRYTEPKWKHAISNNIWHIHWSDRNFWLLG